MDGASKATSIPPDSAYITSLQDGKFIYTRIWKPESPPAAVVLAFHGLGEHINRYDLVFNSFADKGILVKGMDNRGHGRTFTKTQEELGSRESLKGHHDGLDFLFEDMMQVYERPVEPYGSDLLLLPHFVFGHSMGGFLALRFSKEVAAWRIFNFRGTIAQGPMLKTLVPVHFTIRMGLWALGSSFLNSITQTTPMEDGKDLCSDPAVLEAFDADPLNHAVVSIKLARDLIFGGETLLRDAGAFKTPLCIYFAREDKLTSSAAGKEFVEKCSAEDKLYKEFEGALGHEIHFEPSIQNQIIAEYAEWILDRA